jgi:regulator of cell morphogenesis and NO signaling
MKIEMTFNSIGGYPIEKIINTNINSAVVFYSHGIKFYNLPNEKLLGVLKEKNISLDEFLTELTPFLKESDEEQNLIKKDLVWLIDYIEKTHHTFVRKSIQEIIASRKSLELKNNNGQLDLLLESLIKDMTSHLEKEEKILFPLIKYLVDCEKFLERPKTRNYGTVRNPIKQMLSDHETAIDLINKFRLAFNVSNETKTAKDSEKKFVSLISDFELDLYKHIHLENNVLFPKTLELENKLLNK